MRSIKFRPNALVIVTLLLLATSIFQSIYVDGLGVAITVVFPYSLIILIIAIISFFRGYSVRKEFSRWFVQGLIILLLGILILWTPILKHSRSFVERNWRWNTRNQVVDDIKSGNLKPYAGIEKINMDGFEKYYVVVPFEKYGRVSFQEIQRIDNAIEVQQTPETGYVIIFTTYGGFFSTKEILVYIEKAGIKHSPLRNLIDEHWYAYDKEFSFF